MKFKLNRSFFFHSGYSLLKAEPEFGLEVYGTPPGSVPVIAVGFAGKRNKPDWHYRFKSEEARDAYIAKFVSNIEASAEYKLKVAIERRATENLLKLGDILVSSWGYDQTNIDYYEVVAVLPKSVKIRPISARVLATGYESGDCWPIPGSYTGPSKTVRVKGTSVSVRGFTSASLLKKNADGTYPASHWTSYH